MRQPQSLVFGGSSHSAEVDESIHSVMGGLRGTIRRGVLGEREAASRREDN